MAENETRLAILWPGLNNERHSGKRWLLHRLSRKEKSRGGEPRDTFSTERAERNQMGGSTIVGRRVTRLPLSTPTRTTARFLTVNAGGRRRSEAFDPVVLDFRQQVHPFVAVAAGADAVTKGADLASGRKIGYDAMLSRVIDKGLCCAANGGVIHIYLFLSPGARPFPWFQLREQRPSPLH